MAQQDVLDYIRETPHNSNVNVVKGMLGNSGGNSLPEVTTEDNGDILTVVDGEWAKADAPECDCGYSCNEERQTIFDGNITTSAVSGQNYSKGSITPSFYVNGNILVTFDGVEYEVPPCQEGWGEMDINYDYVFTTYPFYVDGPSSSGQKFITPTAGTYSVKIETVDYNIETSKCFEEAVKNCGLQNIIDGSGMGAISEGALAYNLASGAYSHAEGAGSRATDRTSHAEGSNTTASGQISHAEGSNTKASASYSHAEGGNTTASGQAAHAEGYGTTASNGEAHAEGYYTQASGYYSHAEGYYSTASGSQSHAEGYYSTANHRSQHVFGEYNVADPSTAQASAKGTYVEIVGNGTRDNRRSNARTLDWNGNEELQGSLTLGKGTADETTITAAQLNALLALLQ